MRTSAKSEAPADFSSRHPVLLMTNSFDTGGSERQFLALAESLNPLPFPVKLGCLRRRGWLAEHLSEVEEFPLGGSFYSLQSLRARIRMARYLRHHKVQIAHAFDFYTNLALLPVARMLRVPVVIGSQRQMGDLLTSAQFRAQLVVFRMCDRVVCNSHAAAAKLVEHGIEEHRICVIGNGLAPSAFMAAHPVLSKIPGIPRVGMIARMNTLSKNHKVFLRAAKRVRARMPSVEFVLVGDGPFREQFAREAKELGLEGVVHFLGDCKDIPAVLASLEVSVMPSASESLSNAILESMAAAVPVVASRVGGNSELINENRGILVPPGDEEALAAAIEHLLRNQALRVELGHNAKTFAEAHFGIEAIARQYEELYGKLISEKIRKVPQSHAVPEDRKQPIARRARVAIVAASLRYVGGQSVQAELLLRHWKDDPAVEAHFIPIDPPFPHPIRWAESVPFLRTLIREPIYLASLWKGLQKADHAHIFSASYWSFLVATLPAHIIARICGKKVFIHYHSGEARDHLRRSRIARRALANADHLVVPSEYLAQVFGEFGLSTQVVPNIVDLSQFSFRVRQMIRPHIVNTRGFHPYYRVDLVVRAFAEVQKLFPEARLDLVGSGPQEQEIRVLVRRLNLAGVHFTGVVPRREIGRCYEDADIFVNASSLDNMPVSVLEAFASGIPVVSTQPEGMQHLVQHERTGLLSPMEDARALARNIMRILKEPDLGRRLALNAQADLRRCDWSVVRQQWLELYAPAQSVEPEIPAVAS